MPYSTPMKIQNLRHWLKRRFIALGLEPSFRLEIINLLLEYGKWLRANQVNTIFNSRSELYSYLSDEFIKGAPIDYLEFGVFEGKAIREWTQLNQNPASQFFGFDTFEGLPEDWRDFIKLLPKGTFSTGGKLPEIDDRRVSFVKGIFQATLPDFLRGFKPQNRLVINCDADLYTSTLYVLASLDHLICPGTLMIFDELSAMQEFRAFRDYSQSFGKKYCALAATEPFYLRVAIEFT